MSEERPRGMEIVNALCDIIGKRPLFETGELLQTFGTSNLAAEDNDANGEMGLCVARHFTGDWGDLPEEDKEMNTRCLEDRDENGNLGGRLLSAYDLKCGKRIWIITEYDLSVTTVLFPEEY